MDQNLGLQALVALPAFFTMNLALLLIRDTDPAPWSRPLRWGRWVGAVGLVAAVLTLTAQAWGLPLGLVERLSLYPAIAWCAATGAFLCLGSGRATRR